MQGTHETPQEIGDVGHPGVFSGIEQRLEFYSEADFSLSIDGLRPVVLITLLDHLAERAVACIGVRRIKLGSIEHMNHVANMRSQADEC